MPLPTIPATHRWVDGGAVIRYVGSGVTGPGKDATMFCWDRDTETRVTDLYDQAGQAVTEVPVQDNTFYCAVPKAVAKPVFSVGLSGARFAGNDWDMLDQVASHVMGDDTVVAALVADSGSNTTAALSSTYETKVVVAGKVAKGDLLYRVNDYASPQACLDVVPDGATVLFQGTYGVPAGGYVLKSNGLLVEAMGATFNVSDWGTPVFLALRSNGGADDHTFRIGTVQYVGVRGDHTGTLRGSALYCSGCAVWTNGDRNYVERLRSIDMPTPIFFSSWDGVSSADRTGIGNRIGNIEVEGYDFGLLYVKQTGFDWGNAYAHDNVDDSAGANPPHAIYCSASDGNRAGFGRVGQWVVKNHTAGHPFIFKYQDGLTADALVADASYGVLNVQDSDDFTANRVVSTNSLATGGSGAVLFGFTTAACQRPVLGQVLVTQSSGVNERAVNLWADDADVALIKVVSNRSTADPNNGELVVRGNRNNITKLRTRAIGSAQMAALLGLSTDGAVDCCIADVEAFGSSNDPLPVSTFAASLGARWARRSEDSAHAGAAPTTGTWKRGAFVRNYAPNAGATFGWVCTVAGTPGTWKAVSTISA